MPKAQPYKIYKSSFWRKYLIPAGSYSTDRHEAFLGMRCSAVSHGQYLRNIKYFRHFPYVSSKPRHYQCISKYSVYVQSTSILETNPTVYHVRVSHSTLV